MIIGSKCDPDLYIEVISNKVSLHIFHRGHQQIFKTKLFKMHPSVSAKIVLKYKM